MNRFVATIQNEKEYIEKEARPKFIRYCKTYTDIKKADSLSLLLLDIAHNMSNNRYLAHLNNRSIILSIMKRHEEAIKCLEEVRDSYRIIYGVNNPIYATVCHNIGIDYSYWCWR